VVGDQLHRLGPVVRVLVARCSRAGPPRFVAQVGGAQPAGHGQAVLAELGRLPVVLRSRRMLLTPRRPGDRGVDDTRVGMPTISSWARLDQDRVTVGRQDVGDEHVDQGGDRAKSL
jgi:hypothetical protein